MASHPRPVQRRSGGSGGSMQTKPRKSRFIQEHRSALDRAIDALGADAAAQLQATYTSLDSRWGGAEHDQAEGMVIMLLQPDAQVRAVFGVGGSMIAQLKAVIKNGVDNLHTRRNPEPPKHARSSDDIAFFISVCHQWELEDGFPCSHRCPRQYFVEPSLTWKTMWQRYTQRAVTNNRRVIKYCRWTQYVHMYSPGVRLSKQREDLCDACVRIDVALLSKTLLVEERMELVTEKNIHLNAAINQRRAMSDFIRQFVAATDPQQALPIEVVPDHGEIPLSSEPTVQYSIPTIQIQNEDFGGSFPLPVYGLKRPSADYFNSNLLMHNFIVADVTNGINHVLLYDERAQGKGADALCSLRLMHRLKLRKQYLNLGQDHPENTHFLLQVLDNCVGQNKSRVVFMFYAMLSLVFYKKVVLLYLLPGHSHNAAGRVVAWCRRKLKSANLYSPEQIASKMNETESVHATFLDHRSPDRPFFCGWEELLAKYFVGLERANAEVRLIVSSTIYTLSSFSTTLPGLPCCISSS